MKKISLLIAIACVSMTIYASPAKRMMPTKALNPQKAEMMSKSFEPADQPILPYAFSADPVPNEIKAIGAKNQAEKLANPRKVVAADPAVAFYMKPEGTLFSGIDRYGTTFWCLYYPALVGSWLNGNEVWLYKNYAQNATQVNYLTLVGVDYGTKEEYGWSMNESGDFVDTIAATSKGNFGYYPSLRKPMQIASNSTTKDTFMIFGTQSSKLDTCWFNFTNMAGALCPELSADGLWPLTNAMGTTVNFGDGIYCVWNIDEDNNPSYIFGTETIIDSISPTENDTIVPATLITYFEKPMSPLYIKDVTMPILALDGATQKWIDPTFDSLTMVIRDTLGNILAAAIATPDQADTMISFPGKMVSFKIQKKSQYGSIEEGVTINQPFMVYIYGLSRPANNFGIWSAYSPYTSGYTYLADVNGKVHHHAPYDAYIMLNGIYATLEHASHNSQIFLTADYGDTINISVKQDEDTYYAVHADGDWKGYNPALCATELLYDTTTYKYNYKITAPDWAEIYMDSYNDQIWEGYDYTFWDYFSYYDLLILGDANDAETEKPQIGDKIVLNYMGRELVFLVTDVDIEAGLNKIQYINDGKRYDVLGKEVDENYKGVVIMNGKKMLQ